MKIALLRRFVALVEHDLHFPRTADALGIPLASLYTTVGKLDDEVGHPVLAGAKGAQTLTPAGRLLLEEARRRIADAPEPAAKAVSPAGGKAKASKGKGRAPIVKGQPKPYKKRQGR
ncbi:LysR family transcriptional regulator [Microbacterium telephonicum]|uniref:Regulatory helix-turn-helix LysR family protein n=1 Tax=Microbacterium telephonicum TaxID=1714841 RepID=A0A498BWI6_9MICO|nr:LysR family transcriptional regulator [Microbacterium telephonicum]RLK47359.1 regulatory helix-turn-helix LysR family protein [Microbacterium telephonicum]